MRRNRRSGNSHDSLLEFVNSIMSNVIMTQTGPGPQRFLMIMQRPKVILWMHCRDISRACSYAFKFSREMVKAHQLARSRARGWGSSSSNANLVDRLSIVSHPAIELHGIIKRPLDFRFINSTPLMISRPWEECEGGRAC